MTSLNTKNVENRYVTKREMVYRILRENIISGHLKPGSRLVLRAIAEELGVSELPVREALRRLEAERLVKVTPHSGAEVVGLCPHDIREIFAIRSVLEGYATRLAAPNISSEVLLELRELTEKMKDYALQGDAQSVGILNREFHRKIYELSPFPRLQKLIFDLWDESERSRAVFTFDQRRPLESVKEHEAILDAIEAGDGQQVEQIVREHKRRTGDILVEYAERGELG